MSYRRRSDDYNEEDEYGNEEDYSGSDGDQYEPRNPRQNANQNWGSRDGQYSTYDDYSGTSSSMPPGSIEFLESLLQPNGYCRHRGDYMGLDLEDIPERLCFFSAQSDKNVNLLADIYYVETKRLCSSCYDAAVPRGFNVWSTTYFDDYDAKYDNNPQGLKRTHYPALYEAKTRKPANFGPNYPRLPGALIVHECWRYLVFLHQPFYIDQLCIYPPYRPNLRGQAQKDEDRRISNHNLAAYTGASLGVIGTADGGAGLYSMEEQRLLGERGISRPVPAVFGDPNALMELGEGYIVDGDTHWVPQLFRFGGKLKNFDQSSFRWVAQFQHTHNVFKVPSAEEVDRLTYEQTGRHLPMTAGERRRRKAELLNQRPSDDEFVALMNKLRAAETGQTDYGSADRDFKLTKHKNLGYDDEHARQSRPGPSQSQSRSYQGSRGGQRNYSDDDDEDDDDDDDDDYEPRGGYTGGKGGPSGTSRNLQNRYYGY